MAVTVKKSTAGTSAKATPAWMKTGKAASQSFQQEEALASDREAERGKAWRFFLKKGGGGPITFLDGNVNAETGLMDVPMFYEHTIKVGGEWKNYICVGETEPCPICATGDRPSFVAALTVVDHRITHSKDGSKTYRDSKRLFICKRGTLKILNTMALKRDGLAFCTFDVSRTGDKEPNVGNLFDFTQKWTAKEFAAKYDTLEDVNALDYSDVLVYRTAEQLKAIGFSGATSIGGESDDSGISVDDAGI